MKLLTYKLQGDDKERLGVMCANAFQRFYPLETFGLHFRDMNDLIENIKPEEMEMLRSSLASVEGETLNYDEVIHCAPIPHPRQDIICLGMNFKDHGKESARYKKEAFERDRAYPVYFSKRVNEATPDGGSIPSYPGLVDSLDYEAQWYFGKSMDGFTPMGPFIVTEDVVKRPPVLSIKSQVNGVLRQHSSTDLFIFDIPHVISELSSGMVLKAGTIISMGTPAGVGMGMIPPRFLMPGDVVKCDVEGIGMITNVVV